MPVPGRIAVSPRFELFLALAATLAPGAEDAPLWIAQARRKLDQAARRRMGDLALSPAIWIALASVPQASALDGDTDSVIAALADLAPDVFARRCRGALRDLPSDPALERLAERLARDSAGLQQAAVDALRRFDRLVFASLWRRVEGDLEQAALHAVSPPEHEAAIVFQTMFDAHRFQFDDVLVLIVPAEQLLAPPPQRVTGSLQDPELVFRALGDTTRYAIARLIARHSLTGADLARQLGVSGPTLTHHLKVLRRARLVTEEKRGNSVLLRLDRRAIESLSSAALGALFGDEPVAIRRSRRA